MPGFQGVPNSGSNTVDIIDPITYKIIGHFALPKHKGHMLEPQHVVPSWDLKKLWVAQDLCDQLTAIDPATGKQGEISVRTDGNNPGVEIKGADGTVFSSSGNATVPSWVPSYPGSSPTGGFNATTPEGTSNNFTFTTKDSVETVFTFYENAMKAKGFAASSTTKTPTGGLLIMQDSSEKHMLTVTASNNSGSTECAILTVEKK